MKDLRSALGAGEVLLGPGVFSGQPQVVELVGYLGFDWVFIDTEQSPTSPSGRELEELIRAAHAADVTPTVRVAELSGHMINKALNLGAKALWIPHVETREEAERIVQYGRYAPLGERGAAPIVRAARYGTMDLDEYTRASNDDVLLIPIVESVRGIENVSEIASVPGIDAICFGPYDLGVDMGLSPKEFYGDGTSDLLHPQLEAAGRETLAACHANGLVPANATWSEATTRRWIELGFRLFLYGLDTSLLLRAFRELKGSVERLQVEAAGQARQ